jgi:hypothetical protein
MTQEQGNSNALIERQRRTLHLEAVRKGGQAPYALFKAEARHATSESPSPFSDSQLHLAGFTQQEIADRVRIHPGQPRRATPKSQSSMPTRCYCNVTACHPTLSQRDGMPPKSWTSSSLTEGGAFAAKISTYFCVFGILLYVWCRLSARFCTRCAEPSPARKPLYEWDFHRGRCSPIRLRWRVRPVWTSLAKGLGAKDLCPGSSCREGQRSEKRPMVLHTLPQRRVVRQWKRPSAGPKELA